MVLVELISWACFYFVEIFVVDKGIGKVVSLAIGRTVLTETDVSIDFS